MQIGINAHLLSMANSYRAAGVSNYILHLLRGLSAQDNCNHYKVFLSAWAQDPSLAQKLELAGNFDLVSSRMDTTLPTRRLTWEQMGLPRAAKGLDVLHGPVNVVPLLMKIPRVVTIHDLAFLIYSDKHLPSKRRYLTTMTRLSARHSAYVIADSNATRNDCIRLLRMPADKVITIPLAADADYRSLDNVSERNELADFRVKKGLTEPYFLYLGTLEPRKNIPLLIEAYAQLHWQWGNRPGSPPRLVLAGPKGWMFDQIFTRVKELNLESHVLFPGFLSREEIVYWFNGALGFVYLSAFEGFGLPPLQAMQCGVPVIVNNSSSLPEVVGNAGLLVNANQSQEVTDALLNVATDADLRVELSEAGIERAKLFSWERTAQRTLEVYQKAVSHPT